MKTPRREKNGILTVTATLQSQTIRTLGLGAAQAPLVGLFDLSLLAEVYQEQPELKSLS